MEPVLLTKDQINSIIQSFPEPFGIGKNAVRLVQKHRNKLLRNILSTVKLVPHPQAFEDLKEELVKSYYLAIAEPGLPIGLTTAVSLSAPLTQLTLNSFHYAGTQSGTAQVFQKVKAFLTGSKTNPDPQTKLYFKKANTGNDLHDVIHVGTFDDVLARRPDIEQTTVADVVDGPPDVLTKDQIEASGIDRLIQLHSRLRPTRYTRADERYKLTYVARLKLNTYRMYTHQVTMQMLAEAIEGAPPMNSITCIWQSQRDGYMYILLDETQDYSQGKMSQSTSLLLFFGNLFKKFSLFLIRGIPGLAQLEPQEINVLSGIIRTKEKGSELRVYTDNRQTRWQGVSLGDISQFLENAGFQIGPISRKKLYVPILNWSQAIQSKSTNPKISLDNYLKSELARIQKIPEINRSAVDRKFVSSSTFCIGTTFGTNMDELIWRDDLDLFRTSGNNSHEVAEQIGIDAARAFMIFKFSQDLASVNQRHIVVVFSLLTNLGMINSISFTGASRRRLGPLSLASHERGLSVMVNSGAFGEREHLDGISPSVYAGQAPKKIGTYSIGIEEDLTVLAEDQPTMPMFDEITPLEGFSFESGGLSIDDLITQGLTEEVSPPAPVDKQKILNPSKIFSTGPLIPASGVLPSPSLKMASSTLQSALNKLTIGTNQVLNVEKPARIVSVVDFPEMASIPNITTLESFQGIRLVPRTKLASPRVSEVPSSEISGLKAINVPQMVAPAPALAPTLDVPVTLSLQSLGQQAPDTLGVPGGQRAPGAMTVSEPVVVTLPTAASPSTVTPNLQGLPILPPSGPKVAQKPTLQLFSSRSFFLVTPPPDLQVIPAPPRALGQVATPTPAPVKAPVSAPAPVVPAQPYVPGKATAKLVLVPQTAQTIFRKIPTISQIQAYDENIPVSPINISKFDEMYRSLFGSARPLPQIS